MVAPSEGRKTQQTAVDDEGLRDENIRRDVVAILQLADDVAVEVAERRLCCRLNDDAGADVIGLEAADHPERKVDVPKRAEIALPLTKGAQQQQLITSRHDAVGIGGAVRPHHRAARVAEHGLVGAQRKANGVAAKELVELDEVLQKVGGRLRLPEADQRREVAGEDHPGARANLPQQRRAGQHGERLDVVGVGQSRLRGAGRTGVQNRVDLRLCEANVETQRGGARSLERAPPVEPVGVVAVVDVVKIEEARELIAELLLDARQRRRVDHAQRHHALAVGDAAPRRVRWLRQDVAVVAHRRGSHALHRVRPPPHPPPPPPPTSPPPPATPAPPPHPPPTPPPPPPPPQNPPSPPLFPPPSPPSSPLTASAPSRYARGHGQE